MYLKVFETSDANQPKSLAFLLSRKKNLIEKKKKRRKGSHSFSGKSKKKKEREELFVPTKN